ncbi:MAG: hypothetical protein ABI828_06155 [Actinomycetota bacterium]
MDARISGELTRLRIRDLLLAADRIRRTRPVENTRRPEPKGEGA